LRLVATGFVSCIVIGVRRPEEGLRANPDVVRGIGNQNRIPDPAAPMRVRIRFVRGSPFDPSVFQGE